MVFGKGIFYLLQGKCLRFQLGQSVLALAYSSFRHGCRVSGFRNNKDGILGSSLTLGIP